LFSYNIHMTDAEFWRDVGRFLRDLREGQGKTANQMAAVAGIDADTVRAIERGQPGRIDKLGRLVQAFDLSIVDVVSDRLKGAEARPSLEAAALLRAFEHLAVEDRGLLLLFAKRMVEQHEARRQAEPPASTDAPPPQSAARPKGKGPKPR